MWLNVTTSTNHERRFLGHGGIGGSSLTIVGFVRQPGLSCMLPDFDEHGNLPSGIHRATFEEIVARFGWQSDLRRVETESLGWLIELVRRTGAERLIINGSFVTDKLEPNDVDCLVLTRPGFPRDRAAEAELLAGVPFLEMQLVAEEAFGVFVQEVFSSDRDDRPKGMVEVVL